MIPASLLNFLSGLAAGAGMNLLTSVEGGSNQPPDKIITDALIWILVAVALAYTAHLAERVERDAALVIDGNLDPEDKKVILKDEASRVKWQYRSGLILAGALTLVAVALVPGLKF
jgi:hypothetical protein